MHHPASTSRRIEPRSPRFDFARVPRYWLASSQMATHFANGVNMLFPAGERFFVRSVRRYEGQIEDEGLRAQIKGFYGQEGRHASTHDRQIEALRAQGYDVDGFLRWYEKLAYGVLEPAFGPETRLAVTVALEHYTAIMAEGALTDGVLDRVADPVMRDFLKWHAAEEIEHKAVAFEVLSRVDPSYETRMLGLLLATVGLSMFWVAGCATLLSQDVKAGRRLEVGDLLAFFGREKSLVGDVFARGIKSFMRRDFHPLDDDNLSLAERELAAQGMA